MYWFRPFLVTISACLILFTLSRAGIVLWQADRVLALEGSHLGFIFAQGLRFDFVTLGILLGIPLMLTPFFVVNRALGQRWLRLVSIYCLIVIGLVVFMEVATPSFINEYDAKPDRRFIEYLIYPREVFGMLWSAYKLQLFFAAVMVVLSVSALRHVLRKAPVPSAALPLWTPLILFPLLAFSVLVAIRSTNDHRPVNPSTVVFASDPLANQLPLNSSYTALYAVYGMQKEEDDFAYKEVPFAESVAAVRAQMRLPDDDFAGSAESTLHKQIATRSYERPMNLVIVLEESLGAEFVGSLGGLPLTPQLDALQNDGIWFDNLYATGTRSVRGIEAVVAGFPPTTARSVVKLPRAQTGFTTIASLLAAQGYSTAFLYSGEPQFDNMGSFFSNNGFQKIVGRHDFTGEVFDGDWGAADEDLFRMADGYFRKLPADKPFFSLLFTTSNHSPWDYPENRITPYNAPDATRENAVKYADHALGEFIRTAKQSPYWKNTVFLIISDHCSRVYGDQLVPVERFHIPGVIVGGSIKPQRIDRITSQIDMLPTLFSLLGISIEHNGIGIDQTRTDLGDFPGRAIMQYGDTQAYMLGSDVAMLRKDRAAESYVYSASGLEAVEPNPDFLAFANAFANWPWHAYKNQSY